ncbi:MAG: DUF2175 family protein [Clostridia bacterium]|nr:DUF2175 family protein [Clostridia bacterium]
MWSNKNGCLPLELSVHRCALCGDGIFWGHKYFFIKDRAFHSQCLQENLSVKEVLSLLGVEEKTAEGDAAPNPNLLGHVLLGPYKNILVLESFWHYFKRRFPFYREIVLSLSIYKKEKGVWFFSSDQDMLEKWAIMKVRKWQN